MPLPATPDWLTKRDGTLAAGIRDHILLVLVSQQPHFRLETRPAKGQYECVVAKTASGKVYDDGGAVYPTADAAFAGGLERLRGSLGW